VVNFDGLNFLFIMDTVYFESAVMI